MSRYGQREAESCAALRGVFGLLAALVTALVYGLGGTLVIHGVFQVGTLVAFIALVSELYGPLHEVSSLPVEILTALVSFDRVFEILDLKPLITERATAFPLPGADGAPGVEVEGVWFRYPEASQVTLASLESVTLPAPERPGDAWVLRGVTFQAPAGITAGNADDEASWSLTPMVTTDRQV